MHGNLPTDRSNSLADLAGRITAELEAAGATTRKTLQHAIAAGELLIEAKARISHGGWAHWLKKCNLAPRSASKYTKLAEGRDIIENQIGPATDLSINAALRLIKPKKPKKADADPKPAKKKPVASDLSSLAWADAPARKQTSFVDAVGLQTLYAAAPPDHQQKFRVWLLSQEAPAIEQPQAEIPENLSLDIPEFLRRFPKTEAAA